MSREVFRFENFTLDPDGRRLSRDGATVELNARYLDALILLVRENGRLVSKARFLEEVWRGVPVTDEALTQCVAALRRRLGDEAARPRFIETAPKHGYRFIAPVIRQAEAAGPTPRPSRRQAVETLTRTGRAGLVGGALAGLIGGLFYGATAAPGGGGVSSLLVMAVLTMVIGALGGSAVCFGVGAAGLLQGPRGLLTVLGGAAGGLLVGALVKLVGLDAFDLLFGRGPQSVTGAPEGALLGAAIGLSALLVERQGLSRRLRIAGSGALTAIAGLLITVLGGRLMAGSLAALATQFPGSTLRLDRLADWLGEDGFGPVSRLATAAAEGLLFGGCIAAALILTREIAPRPSAPLSALSARPR